MRPLGIVASRRLCSSEGAPAEFLGGLLRKTAVSATMSGSSENLLLLLLLLLFLLIDAAAAVGVQKTIETSAAEPRYMAFEAQTSYITMIHDTIHSYVWKMWRWGPGRSHTSNC